MSFQIRLVLCSCLLAQTAFATGDAPPVDYGFGPPEVVKLDWSTRSLTPADLDGDGLMDLAVINNDAGKIELLYQLPQGESAREVKRSLQRNRWEPVLEDALFEKRGLTIGFPVYDLVVQDFNADGRADLAYTSGEVPLTVRYQSEDGEWVASSQYDGFQALGWPQSIRAEDVDGDGSVELFVLSADAIRVFRHDSEGRLSEPEIYYTSGENPYNLILHDVTGNGRSDLLYLSTDGKQVLAMREQLEGGRFGPERRQIMERPARLIVPLPGDEGEPGSLAAVNARGGALEFMRLHRAEVGLSLPASALEAGTPEIYPLFKKVRDSASYALGDIDGDGAPDLVVANPAEAKLVLFRQRKGRFETSQEFPSFSAVSSLAAGRFHETATESLIVLSETEKTIGRSKMDSRGRLSFPRQIQIGPGDPVVASALDLDGDGYDELILVLQEKGNYRLVVAAPVDRAEEDGAWEALFSLDLSAVRRKPTAVTGLDVFAGGVSGLVVYVPREPPVLLGPAKGSEGIAFQELATASSVRESLLKGLRPAETSTFDVDGDGVNELVVARTGFARAFKVVDDQLEMVDQFNARAGSDVIDAVIPLEPGPKPARLALYVAEARELQFLHRGADGVYRYETSVKVGRLDLQNWFRLPTADSAEAGAYLFAGEDRFWSFNGSAPAMFWASEEIYETDLEEVHYSNVFGADLNADGRHDLVALDGTEHVIDILSRREGEWRSRMFWQVFEQNMHYRGRTGAKLEPREIVVGDFTGDGLPDLVLLVHDRILVYPGI
ncbi:MAG: FG-GAP repeat domain-containing protein [Opitutales bacterium]